MARQLLRLFGGCAVVGGITSYVSLKLSCYTLHRVEGPSMQPTLNPTYSYFQDIVIVKTITQTKDVDLIPISAILCLKHPKQEKAYLIKRLIAKQNEKVPQRGQLSKTKSMRVPTEHCWVESDAGPGYLDSSSYLGPISYKKVVGQAILVIWPPHRIKTL